MPKKSYNIKYPKHLIDETPESLVLKEVKGILTKTKTCFYRIEGSGKIMGGNFIPSESKGLPDILVFKNGTSFGLEIKKRKSGATLSNYQASVISKMNETGNRSGIVFSAKGAIKLIAGFEPDSHIDTDSGLIPVYY